MLFWVFSALSLVYFILCCIFYSPRTSILYFWPLLSLFLFLCIPFPFLWKLFKIPFFLFWFLFFLFLAAMFKKEKEKAKPLPEILLVLGVRNDSTLPSSIFGKRVGMAEMLLKQNPNLCAVLSGGKVFGEAETEARSLFRALVKRGIDPNRLILEEKSRSTKENFAFSASHLAPYQCIGVVTSSYHTHRARLTAKSLGKDFRFYSASAPAFFLPHLALREFFTFSVDLLTGHIHLFSRRNHL